MPGPALPTGPVIPAVYVPDDPWVLLHGHEYRVNLRAYTAQDDLSVSEDKVSTGFYLLEPHLGLASSNHLVPCHTHSVAPSCNKGLREILRKGSHSGQSRRVVQRVWWEAWGAAGGSGPGAPTVFGLTADL